MAKNCWEIKQCGRAPGGANVREFGLCPAALEKRLDGAHHGYNGGRSCWVVAGTLCKGEKQGVFAQKLANCMTCNFYRQVHAEESAGAMRSSDLLIRLH